MAIIVDAEKVQIERLVLGPFATNAYILTCRQTSDSVIVDAPAEAGKILERLKTTHPRLILMTHNHMDHVGALADLKSTLKVALAAHSADASGLPVKPERLLIDGDTLACGQLRLRVFHTPGHTPGSLCFLSGNVLFSGDSLFPGGPGKTWSPDEFKQLVASLQKKIFSLADETHVFPGHGAGTVLGKEKRAFEIFCARPHDPNLCGDVVWLEA